MVKNKKAQTWSTDIMLALVIFGVIIVIVYAIVSNTQREEIQTIQSEASFISEKMRSATNEQGGNPFQGMVTQDKIDQRIIDSILVQMRDHPYRVEYAEDSTDNDYQSAVDFYTFIKGELNLKSEFCIYFTDNDGKLIPLELSGDTYQVAGIGDPDFVISNPPSGDPIRCGMPPPPSTFT